VGNGVTVAAGLADAVPTLAVTDDVDVVEGEGPPPAFVEAAQLQSRERATRKMRLISVRRYAEHLRSEP
jgi:hypothetical protein